MGERRLFWEHAYNKMRILFYQHHFVTRKNECERKLTDNETIQADNLYDHISIF